MLPECKVLNQANQLKVLPIVSLDTPWGSIISLEIERVLTILTLFHADVTHELVIKTVTSVPGTLQLGCGEDGCGIKVC